MPGGVMEVRPVKLLSLVAAASVLSALSLSSTVLAGPSDQLNEAMSYDGLQKVKVKDIDLAYVLPGASLGAYHSVMIDPVYVAFAKNWRPTTARGFSVQASDLDRIRTGMAKLVYDSFSKEIQRKGGFPVVTAAGPDVLRVKLSIINLIVTAPDTMSAGMGRTYVASPGQATLFAEFYDSQTGAILARVLDQQAAENGPGFAMSNSVTNRFAAQEVTDQWARILRDRWDKARAAAAETAKAP
jgi:hypothetical protein